MMNPLLKDRFSYNNGMIIRIDKTLFTENMKHEFFHILKIAHLEFVQYY